jgi:hypothetical protein
MNTGERVIFWRGEWKDGKKIIFPLPATVIGTSDSVCGICREPKAGHARRARRHSYTPMASPGLTLDIQFPNSETRRRENVQLGMTANCWTLNKAGDMPPVNGQFTIDLASALFNISAANERK